MSASNEEWCHLGTAFYYGEDASRGIWGRSPTNGSDASASVAAASASYGSLQGTTVTSRAQNLLLAKHSSTYGFLQGPEEHAPVPPAFLRSVVPHTVSEGDYANVNNASSTSVCPCVARRLAAAAAAAAAAAPATTTSSPAAS